VGTFGTHPTVPFPCREAESGRTTQPIKISTMKLAILILSDPKAGSEESLGRALNAMAFAQEAHRAGDTVDVVFAGPGTRWPAEFRRLGPTHFATQLFESVREVVKGASRACADVFQATDSVRACGLPLLADYPIPGTSGTASVRRYLADGWTVQTF
jgi:hypothetical protein